MASTHSDRVAAVVVYASGGVDEQSTEEKNSSPSYARDFTVDDTSEGRSNGSEHNPGPESATLASRVERKKSEYKASSKSCIDQYNWVNGEENH